MESGEIHGEVYLDNLSNCPDNYSGESEDESDDWDRRIRKRSSELSLVCSDSEEDEYITQDDADDFEEIEDEAWSKVDEPVVVEQYKGSPGIKTMPGSSQDVVKCADLFLGTEFFTLMVNETNRYHSQVKEKFPSRSRKEKWTDVTVAEMKKFLGLILLMGQIKKGGIDAYWTTDGYLKTPYFSKVMSKSRFMHIMESWHFGNNETIPKNLQRTAKIQPLLDYFREKFIRAYTPRRHLTLEECIVPWRGKLSARVRHPSKISKKGILVRMLCEAVTGYVCNFQVFDTDESKLQDTIVALIEPYKNVWHHVYQDNYYNSVEIARILLENKVRMCGIIRRTGGLPPSLQSLRLGRGKYEFRRNHQILLEVWHNGRHNVNMISTIHTARLVDSKDKRNRSADLMQKPKSIVNYEKYTKGIDRAEHHLDYYSVFRKTKKWTKRVAVFFINCALFNSFKVFTAVNKGKYVTYRQFLHKVAVSWTQRAYSYGEESSEENDDEGSCGSKPDDTDCPERLQNLGKHKSGKIMPTGRSAHLLRTCKVCAAHHKKSRTTYFCEICLVPLHKGECFERYHTLEKY